MLRDTSTVTAHYFYFDYLTPVIFCNLKELSIEGKNNDLDLDIAPGPLCNTEKLRSPESRSGFINTASDVD